MVVTRRPNMKYCLYGRNLRSWFITLGRGVLVARMRWRRKEVMVRHEDETAGRLIHNCTCVTYINVDFGD